MPCIPIEPRAVLVCKHVQLRGGIVLSTRKMQLPLSGAALRNSESAEHRDISTENRSQETSMEGSITTPEVVFSFPQNLGAFRRFSRGLELKSSWSERGISKSQLHTGADTTQGQRHTPGSALHSVYPRNQAESQENTTLLESKLNPKVTLRGKGRFEIRQTG